MATAANIADADALLIDSDYVPTPTASSRQPTEHGHGSEVRWTACRSKMEMAEPSRRREGILRWNSLLERYEIRQHLSTSAFSTSASTLERKGRHVDFHSSSSLPLKQADAVDGQQ